MTLAVPLTRQQVDAAGRLHTRLKQWHLSDAALTRLRDAVPGFDAEACLLKTVAVNALYGAQVFAVLPMAIQVEKVLAGIELASAGTDLVGRIAALENEDTKEIRNHVSFAAKFCHFFINEERFPIYDEAARQTIKLHLGVGAYREDEAPPYAAFVQNLATLRAEAGLEIPSRHLDRYLWLTGMYMRWTEERDKEKPLINKELQGIFRRPPPGLAAELDAMLPPGLERPSVRPS